MQAVILAGGLGTRLRPMTYDIPKPMIPINGKPYLEYQIEYLRDQGVRDVLILVGYLGNQIIDHFGNGAKIGVNINYSKEEKPLGTAGGLKNAEKLLEDNFLLIYGDSFLPINYNDLQDTSTELEAAAVICVYDNSENTDVINNISLDNNTRRVLKYHKDALDKDLRYVDAGVLLVNKRIVELIQAGQVVSLENQIFPRLIRENKLYAYITNKRFYDIGTPDRLKLAKEVFK